MALPKVAFNFFFLPCSTNLSLYHSVDGFAMIGLESRSFRNTYHTARLFVTDSHIRGQRGGPSVRKLNSYGCRDVPPRLADHGERDGSACEQKLTYLGRDGRCTDQRMLPAKQPQPVAGSLSIKRRTGQRHCML